MIQGVVEMATKIPEYSQLAIFVELHVNLTFTLSFVLSFAQTACAINQCAKKVVSDSPGLVDFAIGRVFEAGCIAPNLFVLLMFLVTVIPSCTIV